MDAPAQSNLCKTPHLTSAALLHSAARSTKLAMLTALYFIVTSFLFIHPRPAEAADSHTVTGLIGNPVQIVDMTAEDDDWLCGWVPMGTHDSVPSLVPVPAEPYSASDAAIASTPPNDSDATEFLNSTFATAKVTVNKIVEPFIAIGPKVSQSVEQIQTYQRWWKETLEQSTSTQKQVTTDIEAKRDQENLDEVTSIQPSGVEVIVVINDDPCDALTTAQPVDVTELGPSVLDAVAAGAVALNCNADLGPPGIEVKPLRRHVGSTAVIATIEESYMPYDIAARDMRLWNMLPASTRPMSIRERKNVADTDAMWDDFDQQVIQSTEPIPETPAPDIPPLTVALKSTPPLCGSPFCTLEESLYTAEKWLSRDGLLRRNLQPTLIGARVAKAVHRGQALVDRAATALALAWPPAKIVPVEEPSPAGRALLVRAGASEQDEAKPTVALLPEFSCRR